MPWTTFDLATPEGDELPFLREVEEWVRSNCTKTGKIILLSNDPKTPMGGPAYTRVPLDVWHSNRFFNVAPIGMRVKFRSQRDALLFKVFFQDHFDDHTRIRFKWAWAMYGVQSTYISTKFKFKNIFGMTLPPDFNNGIIDDYKVTFTYDYSDGTRRSKLTPKRKALKRAKRHG